MWWGTQYIVVIGLKPFYQCPTSKTGCGTSGQEIKNGYEYVEFEFSKQHAQPNLREQPTQRAVGGLFGFDTLICVWLDLGVYPRKR